MRAYVIDGFGETGSIREVPDPTAAEGQVLVRIRAAGVNPFDATVVSGAMKDRMEHRFPFIPGLDGAGVVDAIGDGVEGYAVGDEVFGAAGKPYFGEGTFAERTAMSVGTIARKPTAIDFVQAASIPTAAIAALTVLDAVDARAGETLLAIGASGGVGSFLVQLGVDRGVRVVGVARAENAGYVRGLGASDVLDPASGDLAETLRSASPEGIDAIEIESPDLVVTDLHLPGTDGVAVMRSARAHVPAIPVVLMSAYPTPKAQALAGQDGAVVHLAKPFANVDFLAAVRQALASDSSAT